MPSPSPRLTRHVSHVDAVDPVRPLAERGVATGANVGDDLAHGVLRADRAVKESLESDRGGGVDVGRGEPVAMTLGDDALGTAGSRRASSMVMRHRR